MTRKKQICEAGQQYLDSMDEFQRYHTYPREAFIDGAKWADEHPNPDTVKRLFEFALSNTNFLVADSLQSVDFEVLVAQAMK